MDVLVRGYELAAELEEENIQLALVDEACGKGFYWTPLTDAPLVAVVPPDFSWKEDTIPLDGCCRSPFSPARSNTLSGCCPRTRPGWR